MENIQARTKIEKRVARLSGWGYLLIFLTGFYANFFVLEGAFVEGDAAATLANLRSESSQFQLGVFSFVLMVLVDIALAFPLYAFLKGVNKRIAAVSSGLRLVNGAVFAIALLSLFKLQFGLEELSPALVQGHMEDFNRIWTIGLLFFALHLLLMGGLVIRSPRFPRLIGGALILAAMGYLVDGFAQLFLPNYADHAELFGTIVLVPAILGELSLTLWLLLAKWRPKSGLRGGKALPGRAYFVES